MAFTLVLFVAPQHYLPIPAPGKLTAGLAIASHLIVQAMSGAAPWRRSRPLALAGALLAWAVVTTPFSLWPGGSVQILQDQYLKSLAAFWLIGSVVDRPHRLRFLLWSLCLMSLPIALSAITNYQDLDGTSRIGGYSSSIASNPNDLALILNVLLPIAVGLLAGTEGVLPRLLLIAVVGLNAGAIVLTFSRAGFLALASNIGLCIHAFIPKGKRILALSSAAGLALSLILLMPAYQDRIATIWNVEDDPTRSAQQRSRGNFDALRLIERHPIVGTGIGNDVLAMNEFGANWVSVHNVYLQHAVDLGLPGLALFVWLFLSCLRCLNDSRRALAGDAASDSLCRAADGIRISLIVFAVSSSFGPVAYHYYFYYTAGLAMAVEHVASVVTAGRVPRRPPMLSQKPHTHSRRQSWTVPRSQWHTPRE